MQCWSRAAVNSQWISQINVSVKHLLTLSYRLYSWWCLCDRNSSESQGALGWKTLFIERRKILSSYDLCNWALININHNETDHILINAEIEVTESNTHRLKMSSCREEDIREMKMKHVSLLTASLTFSSGFPSSPAAWWHHITDRGALAHFNRCIDYLLIMINDMFSFDIVRQDQLLPHLGSNSESDIDQKQPADP